MCVGSSVAELSLRADAFRRRAHTRLNGQSARVVSLGGRRLRRLDCPCAHRDTRICFTHVPCIESAYVSVWIIFFHGLPVCLFVFLSQRSDGRSRMVRARLPIQMSLMTCIRSMCIAIGDALAPATRLKCICTRGRARACGNFVCTQRGERPYALCVR